MVAAHNDAVKAAVQWETPWARGKEETKDVVAILAIIWT
jgi:hypothetical protein